MKTIRLNPWMLFVKTKFNEATYAKKSAGQKLKSIAAEWQALSPDERAVWAADAAATPPRKVSPEPKGSNMVIVPFFRYAMATRRKLLDEGYTFGAASRKLAENWRTMSGSEKAAWIAKATELTKERRAAVKAGTQAVKSSEYHPRRHMIVYSFALFIKEKRMELVREGKKATEIIKVLSEQWRAMDETEKARWADRAAMITRERHNAKIKPKRTEKSLQKRRLARRTQKSPRRTEICAEEDPQCQSEV